MADPSVNREIQMVSFLLDNQEYAVDVMSVREIISMAPITKAANAACHVEGMINLRGSIVPIISLRKCFGLPNIPDFSNCCIAVMDFSGELTGFIIDEVSDVMRIRQSEIEAPQDMVRQPWIQGVINREQRLLMVLDLQHLTEQ